MPPEDTIVAIATGDCQGAIGIVRVSGPSAYWLGEKLTGRRLPDRRAVFSVFRSINGEPLDEGLALFFRGPRSFTGEDSLELQGHGGRAAPRALLQACLDASSQSHPIRLAYAGEFTQRAFLNDRLDLVQAEAVADIIESQSSRSLKAAVRSLAGLFSETIHDLQAQLVDFRVLVEAHLDFSDEDIDGLELEQSLAQRMASIFRGVDDVLRSVESGLRLKEGCRVVLLGSPNAGKSSLMNALSQDDVAIVSDQPGTTRDRLTEELSVQGVHFLLTDTAGLRASAERVEQLGIERSWQSLKTADLVLFVEDIQTLGNNEGLFAECQQNAAEGTEVWRVVNKWDLKPDFSMNPKVQQVPCFCVSARTGQGLDALTHAIISFATKDQAEGASLFSARQRHLEALLRARGQLTEAQTYLRLDSLELLAEHLRLAQDELGEILGRRTSDDLLGDIFSRFCIGK
ncbi:MAG: tRNA uridine-5-carboxymethylaminomethyl(34) synthesis GTPase MnmE [Burkholderiaceae bacterium]